MLLEERAKNKKNEKLFIDEVVTELKIISLDKKFESS